MKILQLDVNSVKFELVKPEASVYEEYKDKGGSAENALLLLTSVEKGDSNSIAENAVRDALKFAKKQGVKKIVIYPFAHLSSNLSGLDDAMGILKHMCEFAEKNSEGIEIMHAPFGWNKKLSIEIKGHPLAEEAKSYAETSEEETEEKAGAHRKKEKKVDLSIVKKSDWSGLPKEDHRTIGEEMDLYSFQEISPAMVYWHPKGWIIYQELVKFLREKEAEYGYRELSTPSMANIALWHVSGHYEHYRDNMFSIDSALGDLGLKPMNCPSTIMIYRSRKWSYKELPFRTAIFDRIYRSELSGAVTGLFRVKELTQDDGHLFVREDQIGDEVKLLLKMVNDIYNTFGMKYTAKLSTMPDDHMGTVEFWDKATGLLKKALDVNGIKYEIKEKEGAFYGPKIDFDVFDSQERAWQLATIQLDYQLPQRFKLSYTGEDGKEHMPVMIHRAILGSLERFIGVMVEHYQGKFPTWLAPVQARIISVSEKSNKYAEEIYSEFKKGKLRAELDASDRKIDYKIREGIMSKAPYLIVIGEKEQAAREITVRNRKAVQKKFKVPDFVKGLRDEIESRSGEQIF